MTVTVPPLADLTAYSPLVHAQRGHLGQLGNFAEAAYGTPGQQRTWLR